MLMGSPGWAGGPVIVQGFRQLLMRMSVLEVRGREVFPLLWAELRHLAKTMVDASKRATAGEEGEDEEEDALSALVDGEPLATIAHVLEEERRRGPFPRSADEPRTIVGDPVWAKERGRWARDRQPQPRKLSEEETKQVYDSLEAYPPREEEEEPPVSVDIAAEGLLSGYAPTFDTGCLGGAHWLHAAGWGKLDQSFVPLFTDTHSYFKHLLEYALSSQGGSHYSCGPDTRLLMRYVLQQDLTGLVCAADAIARFRIGADDGEILARDLEVAETIMLHGDYEVAPGLRLKENDGDHGMRWRDSGIQPLRRCVRRVVEATVGAARLPREDMEGYEDQVGLSLDGRPPGKQSLWRHLMAMLLPS